MIVAFLWHLVTTIGLLAFGFLLVLANLFVKDILTPFWRLYILREKS